MPKKEEKLELAIPVEQIISLNKPADITYGDMQLVGKQMRAYLEKYDNLAVTPDNVREMEVFVTDARKFKRSVEERRLEVRRSLLDPYNEFYKEYKQEFLEPLDTFIDDLDEDTKIVREEERQAREDGFVAIFNDKAQEAGLDFVRFDQLNIKINRTTPSKKVVEDAIDAFIEKVAAELDVLETEPIEDVRLSAIYRYKQSLDLQEALVGARQEHKAKEERRKQEEERRRLAEERRKQIEQEQQAMRQAQQEVQQQEVQQQEVVEPQDEHETHVEQRYVASFKVSGTMEQLKSLVNFMRENEIAFASIDGEDKNE